MISPKQIFKAGRDTKIFEVKDDLQVNSFYNEDGYQMSEIEGKFSRISFYLVDVSKGKKEKALVNKYSFKTDELKDFFGIIKKGGNAVCKYCEENKKRYLSYVKANKYVTFKDNSIEVRELRFSYEKGMRSSSKWKIELHRGSAKPDDSGFGYDAGTYKSLNFVTFFMNNTEVKDMVRKTERFIKLWEQYAFPVFLQNRDAFINRWKDNDYNESIIAKWNNKTGSQNIHDDEKKHHHEERTNNNPKNYSKQNTEDQDSCQRCGCSVSDNIKKVSEKRTGMILCAKCLGKYVNEQNKNRR